MKRSRKKWRKSVLEITIRKIQIFQRGRKKFKNFVCNSIAKGEIQFL